MSDERVLRAKEYAAEEHKRLQQVLLSKQQNRTPAGPSNPVTRASLLTNLAIYSRIYIGSIRFDISEADVYMLFSQFGPVRSLVMLPDVSSGSSSPMNKHRGYGFIEYWTAEGAKLAQSLDECEIAGRAIKIGRPNNFPSDLPPGIPRPLPTRLYVANLPPDLVSDELRRLFEPFGPLVLVQVIDPPLVASPTHAPKKHSLSAYIEYEKVADASIALDALQEFTVCGHRLKICPTIIGGSVCPCGPDLASGETTLDASQGVPTATVGLALKSNSPSCVLALRNVISYEELAELNDGEKDILQDEIVGECNKHGKVVRLILHASDQSQQATAYIQFSSVQEVQHAVTVFNGRWFDGRLLEAEPFDEDRFVMRSFGE